MAGATRRQAVSRHPIDGDADYSWLTRLRQIPNRLRRMVVRRRPDVGSPDLSPELFAAGVSICGMSDLNTFYRNTEAWIAAAAHRSTGTRSATAICSTRYHRCNAWKS